MGAIIANERGTELDTGLDAAALAPLNTYWENIRALYAPFESGQLSGSSDVYVHEIPGGQFTNLLYQSRQLGLTERWPEIKQKYAEANIALGDIPKVTPSSKVVGDLAQFMVAQNLSVQDLQEQAATLAFPDSVVQYLRGELGVPPGGFPEPLRTNVLASRGLEPVEGRPGASMDTYDFEDAAKLLREAYGETISDKDVLSHALYPKVFTDWKDFEAVYVEVKLYTGKALIIKLVSIGMVREDGLRVVNFELNGERWFITVTDNSDESRVDRREKASGPGDIGSPMSGVIVGLK